MRNDVVQRTRRKQNATGGAGGNQADFDTLIELITTTVKPDSWDEVGGPGSVSEFPNGVYVDASGELSRVLKPRESKELAIARLEALTADKNVDSKRASGLRKISLPRLEKHVQLRLAQGLRPTEEMLHLAGWKKSSTCSSIPSRAISCWPDRRATGVSTRRAGRSAAPPADPRCISTISWSCCAI